MNQINLGIHATMLADRNRSDTLAEAIKEIVNPGDIVIDIGAGTGFLSLLAAKQGAKKVYAIECTDMARVARKIIEDNEFDNIITVFQDFSFNWTPLEKADIILCETLGFAVFEERFRQSIVDARERMLKESGLLMPQSIRIYGVPVLSKENHINLFQFRELYDLNYDSASKLFGKSILRKYFHSDAEMSKRELLFDMDCNKMKLEDCLTTEVNFSIEKDGQLGGFLLWFEAHLTKNCIMSSRHSNETNHWGQTFIPLFHPEILKKNSIVKLEIDIIDRHKIFLLDWEIMISKK